MTHVDRLQARIKRRTEAGEQRPAAPLSEVASGAAKAPVPGSATDVSYQTSCEHPDGAASPAPMGNPQAWAHGHSHIPPVDVVMKSEGGHHVPGDPPRVLLSPSVPAGVLPPSPSAPAAGSQPGSAHDGVFRRPPDVNLALKRPAPGSHTPSRLGPAGRRPSSHTSGRGATNLPQGPNATFGETPGAFPAVGGIPGAVAFSSQMPTGEALRIGAGASAGQQAADTLALLSQTQQLVQSCAQAPQTSAMFSALGPLPAGIALQATAPLHGAAGLGPASAGPPRIRSAAEEGLYIQVCTTYGLLCRKHTYFVSIHQLCKQELSALSYGGPPNGSTCGPEAIDASFIFSLKRCHLSQTGVVAPNQGSNPFLG